MQYENITVVIPTYEEKDNIGVLLKLLLGRYPGINLIVVDDSPDDSTIAAATAVLHNFKGARRRVKIVSRHKLGLQRGLTSSVIYGISLAKTRYVIVMDADLQHPISKIQDISKKLAEGYELVVATRADVTNWALHRRIISRLLMYAAYAVLFLRGAARCGDIFSGYFGFEKSMFERTYARNKKRFVGPGFKVLFDLLKCIPYGKIKIGEVPYVFHIRKKGASHAGARQVAALIRSFIS